MDIANSDETTSRGRWVTECVAGITTFFTMAYIVVVNPSILSTPGTGMSFNGVLTATVLLSFAMTLLMGLYAQLPFAVAPGMGINAFFTFNLILSRRIPWPVALGMVFWAGVFFLAVSVTPVRTIIVRAIPENLRIATATGIGIFLTFIGLRNLGLVASDPVTLVKLGPLTPQVGVGLAGLLVSIFFLQRKSPFAFLLGIAAATLIGWACGWIKPPERVFSAPDFSSVLLKLDIWGALQPAFLSSIISLLFTDLFDSLSTFMGVAYAAGIVDHEGQPKNLKQGLIVDAFATLFAGVLGTSSGTAYIESSAGIEVGGRTGWTAVFTALCFLPCLFLGPVVQMVPAYATAPVLILVGSFMFRTVRHLDFTVIEDAIPAFMTIVLIPLSFSITQGILWGFIAHGVLYSLTGRFRDLHPVMALLSLVSVGLLVLEHAGKN